MKATELQIGDWVNRKGDDSRPDKAIRIDWIRTGEVGYYDENGEPRSAAIGIIEPIELTAEILELNGYGEDDDCGGDVYGDEIEIELRLNEWEKEMATAYGWNIRYVHQLQNALKLVGREELAEDFKISGK